MGISYQTWQNKRCCNYSREFYLYGEIYGEIEDYTTPAGFTLISERGTATATVNIREAHIQTG